MLEMKAFGVVWNRSAELASSIYVSTERSASQPSLDMMSLLVDRNE